jgi:cytoskeletal protein CcmA (bactofilin family)
VTDRAAKVRATETAVAAGAGVRQSGGMSVLGATLVVRGEVRSVDDLTIDSQIDGPVICEDGAVTVTAKARVSGDILARDVTILGRVDGQIVATDVVDVRAGSSVSGQVVSRRFILDEGASFVGRVEPQHLEAALRVARYQQRKRDTA